MIKRAFFEGDMKYLPLENVWAQKIRALMLSYGTKYDFCRFYVGEFQAGRAFLGELNGSVVLSESGKCDFEEIAEFLTFSGFSELFCSENAGRSLSRMLPWNLQIVNIMRFVGKAQPYDIETEPMLDNVYKILKTAFDIEYEPWYLDMSHRIRHGVSAFRVMNGSALAIQYNINGEALLSQVATIPEMRGKGNARRLISAVCAELSESEVYVICKDELLEFYGKSGFCLTECACILSSRRPTSA